MMAPVPWLDVWRVVRVIRWVWGAVAETRADRKRKEQQARWEQLRRGAAVIASGRGWTMREVDDAR